MTTIVFGNIGTRDIEDPNRVPGLSAREHGASLLDAEDSVYASLQMPILQPALDFILQLADTTIEQLVLFGTDQPQETPFHRTDTIHYAEVAARLIATRYHGRVKFVTVAHIEGINPSQYDEALTFYSQQLQAYATEAYQHSFLLAAGGIPACNTGLLLQGVRFFGEGCTAVYAANDGTVTSVSIGQHLITAMREHTLISLLNSHHFAAAWSLTQIQAESIPSPAATSLWLNELDNTTAQLQHLISLSHHEARQKLTEMLQEVQKMAVIVSKTSMLPDTAITLLHYGMAQQNLDTDAATKQLARLPAASNNPHLESLQTQLAGLTGAGNEQFYIPELFFNAQFIWDQGRIRDFLLRAAWFQQAVLSYLRRLYHLSALDDEAKVWDKLDQAVNKRRHDAWLSRDQLVQLRDEMSQAFNLQECRQLMFELGVNHENIPGDTLVATIQELITHAQRHGLLSLLIERCQVARPEADLPTQAPEIDRLPILLPALKRLRQLPDALNPPGQAISLLSDIRALYAGEARTSTPVSDMAVVCHGLGLDISTNPYEIVRLAILTEMRRVYE